MNFGAKSSRVAMVKVVSAGDHGYGTLESGAPRKRRGNGSAYLSSAITVTAALAVVALVTLMAQESPQPYAVVSFAAVCSQNSKSDGWQSISHTWRC
eukprot:2429331-Rhodomonas_salina.1